MSKCSECPFKMYPLLIGDCPEIKLDLRVLDYPIRNIAGYEPNQFCFTSCSGSKQEVELCTCKFFNVPDIYWRKRYLTECMEYDHQIVYGS